MKQIVILYHAECPDGFGGAWAAHKKFGENAEYIGVDHDSPPPPGLDSKEIYMVDFCYPEEIMAELIKKNKRVTAIDHHAMREKAIKLTTDYLYSNDHSGSVLAWNYFHEDTAVPLLLRHIEDQDLWRFNLPDTNPVVTFLESFGYDFKLWDRLAGDMEDDVKRKEFIGKGSFMVSYRVELVKRIVKENSRSVEFEGYKTFVVNAPSEFADRVGELLYTTNPPLAVIWSDKKDGIHVSLRSDGTVDVSRIATKFGGGGHKASAGFSLPSIDSFPWKEINT